MPIRRPGYKIDTKDTGEINAEPNLNMNSKIEDTQVKIPEGKPIKKYLSIMLLILIMGGFTYYNYTIGFASKAVKSPADKTSILGKGQEGNAAADSMSSGKKYVGISIPSVVTAQDGKTNLPITNTGNTAYVPVVDYQGKEIYRGSRYLKKGETMNAFVNFGIGGADNFQVGAQTEALAQNKGVAFYVKAKIIFN